MSSIVRLARVFLELPREVPGNEIDAHGWQIPPSVGIS